MQISYGSAYEIIRTELGFYKVCVRCIPKELIKNNNQSFENLSSLTEPRSPTEDVFLKKIIPGDETWIQHCEPESKRQKCLQLPTQNLELNLLQEVCS